MQLCCGGFDGVPILTTVSHVRETRTQHPAHLQLSGEEGSHVDYDVKRQDLSRLLNTMWMRTGAHVAGMTVAVVVNEVICLARRSPTTFQAGDVSWRVAEHLRHNDRKLTRLAATTAALLALTIC